MSMRALSVLNLWCALSLSAGAQSPAPSTPQPQTFSETQLHIRYNSGQDVVPIYEGWERVPDGSFDMVFGYMNRNHVEELSIPVGAQNGFEPGLPDRGQPAYFYPRENHFIFRVNVPKTWEKNRELIWTITAHGKTNKARGTLLDFWEIDRKNEVANNGGGVQISNALIAKDQPPVIAINPVARATAGTPVTISAAVTDDGIPAAPIKPRAPRNVDPSLRGAPPSPVNVPLPQRPRPLPGLSVLWTVYRGPGQATFDPEGYSAVKDGKVQASATFTQPGTYVIRAWASDGLLRTAADITVSVQ